MANFIKEMIDLAINVLDLLLNILSNAILSLNALFWGTLGMNGASKRKK